jgi:hypothetical protein
MQDLTTLLLKLPRNTEVTPEAAQTFLSAITQINSVSFFQKIRGMPAQPIALEIVSINQQIQFLITCHTSLVTFVKTQIQSNYPLVIIQQIPDPAANLNLDVLSLRLKHGSYYPIAVYTSFTDIDPMSSILSVLAKSSPSETSFVQFALEATSTSWQSFGTSFAEKGIRNKDGSYSPRTDQNVIKEKISYPGFKVSIRIASNAKETQRNW